MKDALREKYLLYRIQSRKDPVAYAEMYDRYVTSIYRFVFFKVSNHEDAEDITADVFLKAWHYVTEHTEIRSFRAIIYRIARNLVIDLYRHRSHEPSVPLTETFDESDEEVGVVHSSDAGAAVLKMESEQDHARVLEAIGKLKEEYREVLLFRYVDGLSTGEVADILGKSKIDVRVTTHRAMKALRKILGVA